MIILIAHQKGGVGKSTLAVNFAAELQARGKDVLIAEADPTIHTARVWAKARKLAGGEQITSAKLEGNITADLKDLGRRYDYVIVDVAGKDSREMRSAMLAAHVMVAPMQPSQPDMDAAESLSGVIEEARDFNPELTVLAVLNRCPTNWNSSEVQEAIQYLRDFPILPLASVRIHERKVFRTSMEAGRGVTEMGDQKAKAEIQILLDEVIKAGVR